MLKMQRVTTTLLLYAWFCGATKYNTSYDPLIEKIYGRGPFDVLTEEPSVVSIVNTSDSCKCSDELSASGAQNCVCVRYQNCRSSKKKIVDRFGKGLIHIRIDDDHPRSCPHSLEWCCSLDNVTYTPILPTVHKQSGCGWRNPDGVNFKLISNSNVAQFGEFPWMVALLSYTKESAPWYKCGGTLIHPQAVITGAHCVVNETTKYLIRAGEWDSQSMQEPYPTQDRKVKSIVIHPNFSEKFLFNNVAFLLLESPVDMANPNVGVACLPQQGETFRGGTECFATGWGKEKFGQEGRYEVILKKINLPFVERNVCQENLRKTTLGKYYDLDRSFICAGGELGKDTCEGDGGSPLVCPIPGITNRYQLAGIVSWGIGCGDARVPGVYADVAFFRNWIDQQAINNDLDHSTYTY